MRVLYLYEPETKVSYKENRLEIFGNNGLYTSIPSENVEGMVLFGNIQLTGKVISFLMERGIPVTWLSHRGRFFGRLESTSNVNIRRQRMQFRLGDNKKFCLELAKKFIAAKINNQKIIIRRYNRNIGLSELRNHITKLNQVKEKVLNAPDKDSLLGYEGNASRVYFNALSKFVDGDFTFNGRSKRPPKDRFNSLLSFGYTLLIYDTYSAIVSKGLNPYAGFLHQDKEKHPCLASDMIEEWRPVIVDSMVLNIIHRNKIDPKSFEMCDRTGGVYLGKEGAKTFAGAYEKKLNTKSKYLDYLSYELPFRRAILAQANALSHAIEEQDPSLYHPVSIW